MGTHLASRADPNLCGTLKDLVVKGHHFCNLHSNGSGGKTFERESKDDEISHGGDWVTGRCKFSVLLLKFFYKSEIM